LLNTGSAHMNLVIEEEVVLSMVTVADPIIYFREVVQDLKEKRFSGDEVKGIGKVYFQ
jgi:hypothetical protein